MKKRSYGGAQALKKGEQERAKRMGRKKLSGVVCPIDKKTQASKEHCLKEGASFSRNTKHCQGCKSPWRICLECARNTVGGGTDLSVVADSASGLCRHHKKHQQLLRSGRVEQKKVETPEQRHVRWLKEVREVEGMVQHVALEKGDVFAIVRTAAVVPMKGQPRRHFDERLIVELGRSLKERGQMQRIICYVRNGKIHLIDGERRLRSALEEGHETIEATIKCVPVHFSEEDAYDMAVVANFHRQGHSHLEILAMLQRIAKRPDMLKGTGNEHKGRVIQYVSAQTGMPATTLWSVWRLEELDPEILKFLDPGLPEDQRLGLQTALALVKAGGTTKSKVAVARTITSQRMTVTAAKLHIARNLEVVPGSRGRKRDDVRRLDRFVNGTSAKLELMIEQSRSIVASIRNDPNQGPAKVRELARQMEGLAEKMKKFATTIKEG